jgi:hypothetical protein
MQDLQGEPKNTLMPEGLFNDNGQKNESGDKYVSV